MRGSWELRAQGCCDGLRGVGGQRAHESALGAVGCKVYAGEATDELEPALTVEGVGLHADVTDACDGDVGQGSLLVSDAKATVGFELGQHTAGVQ